MYWFIKIGAHSCPLRTACPTLCVLTSRLNVQTAVSYHSYQQCVRAPVPGVSITLKGSQSLDFLEKLVNVVLPNQVGARFCCSVCLRLLLCLGLSASATQARWGLVVQRRAVLCETETEAEAGGKVSPKSPGEHGSRKAAGNSIQSGTA